MSEKCTMRLAVNVATKDELIHENTSVFKIRFKKASKEYAADPSNKNFMKLVGAAIDFKNSIDTGNRL